MASYTITGHPLNYAELALTPGAAVDAGLLTTLKNNGVGTVVNITLADDTKAKGHGSLR